MSARQLLRIRRLRTAFALNVGLMIGLVIVGIAANSVGLLAAAADDLGDLLTIGFAIAAIRVDLRKLRSGQRASRSLVTASGTAIWILLIGAITAVGAILRILHPPHSVDGPAILVASGVAGIVLIIIAFTLEDDDEDEGAENDDDSAGYGAALPAENSLTDHHERHGRLVVNAAFIDAVTDALAAFGVAIAGAIMTVAHGLYLLDPIVALVVALVMIGQAWRLGHRISQVRAQDRDDYGT
ncbi:MAG: cation diffusion facilitator family transporter [Acidimicrobiales bacterium]